jgi:hypothetical protein
MIFMEILECDHVYFPYFLFNIYYYFKLLKFLSHTTHTLYIYPQRHLDAYQNCVIKESNARFHYLHLIYVSIVRNKLELNCKEIKEFALDFVVLCVG